MLAFLAAAFGDSDRSAWLFLALVAFFAAWAWQAIDAYRQAVAAGAAPRGAIQALALAPVAVAIFTGFWVVAGSSATPNAALQRYVAAWRTGNAPAANLLFARPPGPEALRAVWARQETYVRGRLAVLRAAGAIRADQTTASSLDPLVFVLEPGDPSTGGAGSAAAAVDFVRQETASSSFFGLFPTATQRTRVVERAGEVRLAATPRLTPVGSGSVWRIESVEIGSP